MSKIILLSLVAFLFTSSPIFSANELSVKDNDQYGSKPGYIEKATLVIEPFGSYTEQSLYLEYSERNQFTSNLLEIVHRFELPNDAVINDMWLWIGDSVMQARMYDTWSAREVYDSIVAAHYDPAFLAKIGSQYELKVYPLASGGRRKVKINFIVPTLWYGNQATAELPLEMLQSNNADQKPLEILYRTKQDSWGTPTLLESPELEFDDLVDTLDYHFQYLHLDDISEYTSLNFRFNTQFNNGYLVDGYQDKSSYTYFQLGILPADFFNIKSDSSSQNVLVALDFSGSFKKDIQNNVLTYRLLIENSLKPNDKFKFFVSGDGEIINYTDTFMPASEQSINGVFNEFIQSDFAESIDQIYTPNILFCDYSASVNWNYNDLSLSARLTEYNQISSSINSITSSNVVAAYRHGYDDLIDQNTADQVIEKLDSLFINGGRFLTYYDYNREDGERLATHYINELKVKKRVTTALTLYRSEEGNIGMDFPESITRNASYFLEYNDPDVKVELVDEYGDPAVISKKIDNGLIVVSGIWSLRDDDAMKALLGAPLLGVNSNTAQFILDELLNEIKVEFQSNSFSKVIILSDSDSLISKDESENMVQEYFAGYGEDYPRFLSINLLDNEVFTPPSISDNQVEYYGSGYFLSKIADASNGIHMEKHLFDWQYIHSVFSPYTVPSISELNIEVTVDNGNGELLELREINEFPDPNKPRFFLGKSNSQTKMNFQISARFDEADTDSLRQFEFLVPYDTTSFNKIISSMLGYENILDKLNETPIDTLEVVRLSIDYNLLTDFTALLALEPNDTLHFMNDPFDESTLTTVEDSEDESDSTYIVAYPNPFNNMVKLQFNLEAPSIISAAIYNFIGQKIFDVANDESVEGTKIYTWNGRNNFGSTVSSGFYIIRAIITDQKTKKENVYTHKLILLK
ncbi:MAG: VIT domain-containing protein [Ignavibacteria bacterium]|jgi:hypothetical protein